MPSSPSNKRLRSSEVDEEGQMQLSEGDSEHAARALPLSPSRIKELPVRSRPLPEISRPDLTPRRSTDPSLSHAASSQSYFASQPSQTRPHTSHVRTRSPFSRSHLRSKSSGSVTPVLTRARSMPNQFRRFNGDSASPSPWSSSSSFVSPPRIPSPLRTPSEEYIDLSIVPGLGPILDTAVGSAVETIEEDSELDITNRTGLIPPHLTTASAAFGRSGSLRRRPASPLQSLMGISNASCAVVASHPVVMSESLTSSLQPSSANSPTLGPQVYNEAYPSLHHYASTSSFSSMPSTPTSQRSRSPSISSLDTIEDNPDLESQAIEDERIESLRLAAERQERQEKGESEDEGTGKRRGSFDMSRGLIGRGSSRERKRWSVCGGERRADLDLETIWED